MFLNQIENALDSKRNLMLSASLFFYVENNLHIAFHITAAKNLNTYHCWDHRGPTCLTTLAHCSACLVFEIFSCRGGVSRGRLPPPVFIRNYGGRRGGGVGGRQGMGRCFEEEGAVGEEGFFGRGSGGVEGILSSRRSKWMAVVNWGNGKPRVRRQVKKNGKSIFQS